MAHFKICTMLFTVHLRSNVVVFQQVAGFEPHGPMPHAMRAPIANIPGGKP